MDVVRYNLIQKIGFGSLNLISKTWRIEIKGEKPTEPSVICFWHGFMLPAWKVFQHQGAYALVSQSKDGELLSRMLQNKWGFTLLRGSSSKGGKEVLYSLIDTLKSNIVLMTPDGPRGPRYKFKPGAVVAAQRTGKALVLCSVEIKRAKIFNKSWDHFRLPFPFSKMTVNYSQPYKVGKELSREEINQLIEKMEKEL